MSCFSETIGILEPEKDSEIELIKDFNKKNLKGTPRTLEVKSEDDNQTTIVLKKNGRLKETYFGIKTVSEIRHSESTNLIQLTSRNNDLIILRTKTKASKDRWIHYLSTLAQNNEENIYEDPEHQPRIRSATEGNNLVKPQRRTPRDADKVQSVVNSHVVTIPPTRTEDVMGALQEDAFDITASGAHDLSSMKDGPSSFRWQHHPHRPTALHHIYDNTPHTGGTVINVNINVQEDSRQSPSPPRRHDSLRSGPPTRSTGEPQECDEREANCRHKLASKRRSEKGRNDRPTPRPAPRKFQVCQPDQFDSSEFDTRQDYRQASSQLECRPSVRELVEAQEEMSSLSLSPAAKEESLYANLPLPGIYVVRPTGQRRMADDLKSEQNDETIIQSIDRKHLRKMEMKTMSTGGVWIREVPSELRGVFYEGDKITTINEQRIFDETFAQKIIETSEREKVRVSVKRLLKGHVIEMDRTTNGDPLGFQLNGTQIASISPATPFARQAAAAFAEVMCITHINDEYVHLHTSKTQVNQALRDADLSFFIVLQPLDFMRELTRHS